MNGVLTTVFDMKGITLKYFSTILLSFLMISSYSQKQKAKNLYDFDNRDYHFGFLLAYNSADYFMEVKPNYFNNDSLISIQNFRQPGFNLGIIGSWNLNKNISFRFLPDLSFQDRKLDYTYIKNDTATKLVTKRIEATFLNFPINLKLRTDRINNVAFYAIGGIQFGVDMASQKDVNNAGANTIVKVKRTDWQYQVGGGIDFFLPYFKFGIELKYGRGIKNVLIQDGTKFADPISSLRSRMWTLSFTFEG